MVLDTALPPLPDKLMDDVIFPLKVPKLFLSGTTIIIKGRNFNLGTIEYEFEKSRGQRFNSSTDVINSRKLYCSHFFYFAPILHMCLTTSITKFNRKLRATGAHE